MIKGQEEIILEEHDLRFRMNDLRFALETSGFREKVGDYQYKLLRKQYHGMEEYHSAIMQRLSDLNAYEEENEEVVDFGTAIKALRKGYICKRKSWADKGMFIIKQIPSHIEKDVIPNMQSLPRQAKNALLKREKPHIDYTNQLLVIDSNCNAESWTPSTSDIFAYDWRII